MSENQQNWLKWARALQRWGITESVATFLENAGSLNIFAAQILYLSQPILSGAVASSSLYAFARVLENPDDRNKFITFLREVPARAANP